MEAKTITDAGMRHWVYRVDEESSIRMLELAARENLRRRGFPLLDVCALDPRCWPDELDLDDLLEDVATIAEASENTEAEKSPEHPLSIPPIAFELMARKMGLEATWADLLGSPEILDQVADALLDHPDIVYQHATRGEPSRSAWDGVVPLSTVLSKVTHPAEPSPHP